MLSTVRETEATNRESMAILPLELLGGEQKVHAVTTASVDRWVRVWAVGAGLAAAYSAAHEDPP